MTIAHEVRRIRKLLRLSPEAMATALGFKDPPDHRREILLRIEAGEFDSLSSLDSRMADVRAQAARVIDEEAKPALLSALALQHALAHARLDASVVRKLREALAYEIARLRLLHAVPKGIPDAEIPAYAASRPVLAKVQRDRVRGGNGDDCNSTV